MNFERRTLNVELRMARPLTQGLGPIGRSKLNVERWTLKRVQVTESGPTQLNPKPRTLNPKTRLQKMNFKRRTLNVELRMAKQLTHGPDAIGRSKLEVERWTLRKGSGFSKKKMNIERPTSNVERRIRSKELVYK